MCCCLFQSSQEFVNAAFEPDETVPKDFKFRDLVEHALRQQNDEFLHPFGRSNLYTSVFLGEKTNSDTNGSKLAFWGILLLVLLGISGGIIFMAGAYLFMAEKLPVRNVSFYI